MNIIWKFPKEVPSEQDIKNVEEKFNITFPLDYIECIKINNGARPKPKTFDFDGHKENIFSSLLSIRSKDKENILEVYEWIKDRLPDNVYPFAKDPFGNYICFKYEKSENNSYIVFWNHEKANDNKQSSIDFICKDFKSLLEKLY